MRSRATIHHGAEEFIKLDSTERRIRLAETLEQT
jgi:hypothetical protein